MFLNHKYTIDLVDSFGGKYSELLQLGKDVMKHYRTLSNEMQDFQVLESRMKLENFQNISEQKNLL